MDNTPETEPGEAPANEGNSESTRWPVSGEDVSKNTANLDEEDRTLLRWFYSHCLKYRMPMSAAAEKAGVNKTTVFRVFKGAYADKAGRAIRPKDLLEGVRKYKREEDRRTGVSRVGFVETPTTKQIENACLSALTTQSIVMIFGESQMGKSKALERVRQKYGAGVVRYISAIVGMTSNMLLNRIARASGVSHEGTREAVMERVMHSLDEHVLLIVDEAHLFTYGTTRQDNVYCLETLRCLHNEVKSYNDLGFGMVLCGTNAWRNELEKGRARGKLQQLSRRGAHVLQLPDSPTRSDLAAIYKASGLENPNQIVAEMMEQNAARHGLTKVFMLIQYGRRLAAERAEPLAWQHITDAADMLTKQAQPKKDWDE